MATTYREIAYSVLTTLKQDGDDSELTISHIVYYIDLVLNRLRAQHIQKSPTGALLTLFNNVSVVVGTDGAKYIELPVAIYDFVNDKGIDFVSYSTFPAAGCEDLHIPFTWVEPSKVHRMYLDKYEKPSPSNPYMFRIANKVYLLGIECVDIKDISIALYTAIDFSKNCDIDTEVDITSEHMLLVEYQVLELAKFGTTTIKDNVNDGDDTTSILNRVKTQQQVPQPQQQQ